MNLVMKKAINKGNAFHEMVALKLDLSIVSSTLSLGTLKAMRRTKEYLFLYINGEEIRLTSFCKIIVIQLLLSLCKTNIAPSAALSHNKIQT